VEPHDFHNGHRMKLLAFETATEACSVALWIDGEVRERFDLAPRRHAELALPWADALLAEAGVVRSQLDAVAVGRGPGAFTGVRLAVAIAQGIALALDIPVVPVSTLAVLAMRATPGSQHVLAAIDARMGEIYLGAFAHSADGLVAAPGEEILMPPQRSIDWPRVAQCDAVHAAQQPWIGVGSGFAASDSALVATLAGALKGCDASALPHASDLARLAAAACGRGEALSPERVEPAYLRDKVALTLSEQGKR
jgi:tRNA threonylcarbamoyladenosine biosynthesis protein TsaB